MLELEQDLLKRLMEENQQQIMVLQDENCNLRNQLYKCLVVLENHNLISEVDEID